MSETSKKIPSQPSKPGKDTIYVDVEDEITSIIDKVENAKQKVVALVLPKRSTSLQSVVNMRLLKRSADSAGKNVVLITAEPALLPLAGAAGIHVAKNLQSKPAIPPSPLNVAEPSEPTEDEPDGEDEADAQPAKLDYHRSIGELAAVHEEEDPEVISLGDDPNELPKPKAPKSSGEKVKRLSVPNFERFRLLLGAGIVALVALIVFIFMAIFVLPKATITIKTSSDPIAANLTLTATDKITTLDEAGNKIPAILKATKQSQTQTAPATGQQNNGEKATGTMSFYNCNSADTLSGTDHTVPAGTGVSANGLTYITQQSVTVSPSHFNGSNCKNDVKSSSVAVKAQSGGAKYNQDAATYSVSGFSSISGNGSKMTGGTDNNATVVSQQDVDNARQKVTSASSDEFTKKFFSELDNQDFYVIKSTLKIEDPVVTATPAVGEAATTTTVSVQITYNVLVLKKDDLKQIIINTLNDQIDKGRQTISAKDVLKEASVSVQSQSAPATATLNVSESTTAVPIIDVAQVKKLAAGKKDGDIRAFISNWPGVKEVDVKMTPFWVSKAPKKQNKITVKLVQVKN